MAGTTNAQAPGLHFGWHSDVVGTGTGKVPVLLNPGGLKHHTAIIAQSGAGKSFTLGRLLEEISCWTKARTVILDPNSDFARFGQVENGAWKQDHLKSWFGPKDTLTRFTRRWNKVGVKTLTLRASSKMPKGVDVSPISLNWGDLSLLEKVDHLGYSASKDPGEVFVVDMANVIVRHNIKEESENADTSLSYFLECVYRMGNSARGSTQTRGIELPQPITKEDYPTEVSESVAARCYELTTYDVWDTDPTSVDDYLRAMGKDNPAYRVLSVDLASVPNSESRLRVAKATLDSIFSGAREAWTRALGLSATRDKRTPTFIVLDEAHNMAPSEPETRMAKAVTDSVVTIAAEGRKYGLFLILVTQRPSRLHPTVLSQCDNLCLLRMNNRHDLDLIENVFGFVPDGMAKRALDFGVGDCLLSGGFVEHPVFAHVAPRRTVEGGRNLRDSYWASDPLEEG